MDSSWCPDIYEQEQGMVTFIHITNNESTAVELVLGGDT
jgi:hypothetical protein